MGFWLPVVFLKETREAPVAEVRARVARRGGAPRLLDNRAVLAGGAGWGGGGWTGRRGGADVTGADSF